MALPDFQQLLNSKSLLSVASAIGGALLGNFAAVYRNRIKVLEYTVSHERVGLSTDDAIFGSVRITWQGQDATNLFTSILTIENTTLNDYTDLKVKIYTRNTLLLTERTEIAGTTYIPKFTTEFAAQIFVPHGSVPTDAQFQLYRHQREYLVPVLNRGQRVVFHYLTTAPNPSEGPLVWADLLHPSVQLQFRPISQQIHGVPVKLALPLGLFVCLLMLAFVSMYLTEPWAAAVIMMIAGLSAQSIGAWVYRAFRFIKQILLR